MASPTRTAPETDESRRDKRRGRRQPLDLDELDDELIDDRSIDDTEREAADDAWNPDDDTDLGLDGSDDEDVGLDASTGFDDAPDDADEIDGVGEGVSWTADSEDADDLPDTDADVGLGEEYGWLGDDDGPSDDDAFDPELGGDEAVASPDDGGAEGLDDDADFDGLDMAKLPQLDADAEDPEGAASGEGFDELANEMLGDEASLAEDPVIEVAPGVTWKRIGEANVRITNLALPSAELSAATACDDGGHAWLVLGARDVVLCSRDAGVTFEPIVGISGNAGVALVRGERAPVLWALDAAGELAASRDGNLAHTEACSVGARVVRITGDGSRVFVLAQHDSAATPRWLQRSSGIRRFVPSTASSTLAALMEPACLLDEDDETFAYACVVADATRVLVTRSQVRQLHQGAGASVDPLVIAVLERAAVGEPRALAASCAEGLLTLYVVTDRALVRIEAGLDGETPA